MTVWLARLTPLMILLTCLAAAPVFGGTCTNPAGNEADSFYSKDFHTFQFCNGTSWIAFGPGACFAPQTGAYQPTIPSGSGFFVISGTTWTGSLGGLTGADALCLTELKTTNTSWRGHSTANSNGQLISSKVHAFLCGQGSSCNSLMPLTTYYFANATNSGAGGASFTTDAYGNGPQDSAAWSAANYFSGTYTYWTNVGAQTNSLWASTPAVGNQYSSCDAWADTSLAGYVGISTSSTSARWESSAPACTNSYYLICFVNP